MSYKQILVHLDNSARCRVRVQAACQLAVTENAQVVGLFAQTDPAIKGFSPDWPSEFIRSARADAEQTLSAVVAETGCQGRFEMIETGSPEEIQQEFTARSMAADLVVLGQRDPQQRSPVTTDFAEKVMLNVGRPTLIIPYVGDVASLTGTAVVAWNHSIMSARALRDAIPLLSHGKKAIILELITDEMKKSGQTVTEKALLDYLGAHGVQGELEAYPVKDIKIMDLLLSRATDMGASVLVMGAHGHYGFPNFSKGKGTRYILEHMTLPVMFSN